MEEELSVDTIKSRAIKGIATLTGRTFVLQAIAFGATFLLTIFLDPSQYGTFFLVSAVINFFTYFSDIGLAAALIQKKETPSQEELRTTFTVQQLLILFLVALILILLPLIRSWYNFDDSAMLLMMAITLSLFLSSLKTIPSVLLERKLDFNRLVIPQIVETILFYSVAVYLAWKGFGITSFTVAVLVRGISGLVMMYLLSPWMPGIDFSREHLKKLLKYGLPYQANTFLAVFKDDGMTAILGSIIGPSGIGLLGWAQKWASAPLRFFMDQVIKVTFPGYSRLQNNITELSKAVNQSIFVICLFVFPALLGLIVLAPALTEIIPKYSKWQPALLALSLISINTIFAAFTTPLTNLLNAVGKIKVTFRLMIMWTVLTWIFVPILALNFGINGAALGYALVGVSSVVAVFVATRYVKFDLMFAVGKPLIAAVVMAAIIYQVQTFLPLNFVSILFLISVGVLVYSVAIILLVGIKTFKALRP